MKKKFFPSPRKISKKFINPQHKTLAKKIIIKDAKPGKSLRKEFDLIINKHYSMLSAQETELIWHIIGTQIAHNKSHTGSLKILIKDSIRLISIPQ